MVPLLIAAVLLVVGIVAVFGLRSLTLKPPDTVVDHLPKERRARDYYAWMLVGWFCGLLMLLAGIGLLRGDYGVVAVGAGWVLTIVGGLITISPVMTMVELFER